MTSHFIKDVAKSVSALTIAIVYEDFETGKQAKRTYDYLVEVLGRETQFTNIMWKFDVLTIPKLREIAAKDAAMADIVIVSCHGARHLPPHVQMWMDQWLAFPYRTMALVSLCDCDEEHAQAVRSYIESVAERGHLEFFSQPEKTISPRRMPPPHAETPASRQGKTIETLSGAMRREMSIPRWGINE